jgi:hypothetical protein
MGVGCQSYIDIPPPSAPIAGAESLGSGLDYLRSFPLRRIAERGAGEPQQDGQRGGEGRGSPQRSLHVFFWQATGICKNKRANPADPEGERLVVKVRRTRNATKAGQCPLTDTEGWAPFQDLRNAGSFADPVGGIGVD